MNAVNALSTIIPLACCFGSLLACSSAGDTPIAATRANTPADTPAENSASATPASDAAYVLDFKMDDIHGQPRDLNAYKGKVVLVVNVASKCGLTPQYEALESVYEKYRDQGLVVLGFPANNFGRQEPGTNEEIVQFCTKNYGVTFPMFAKISVKGDDQDPLYELLTNQPDPIGGEVQWNFQKYLVDRSGRIAARFDPRVTPDDPALIAKLTELLQGS